VKSTPLSVRCYIVAPPQEAEELKKQVDSQSGVALTQSVAVSALSNETLAEMLVAQTLRAMTAGNLLAKKTEMDLLLRVAGTTQISEAIEGCGARRGQSFLLIVVADPTILDDLEESPLRGARRLQRAVLSKSELMAVERAALLNVLRA